MSTPKIEKCVLKNPEFLAQQVTSVADIESVAKHRNLVYVADLEQWITHADGVPVEPGDWLVFESSDDTNTVVYTDEQFHQYMNLVNN